MPKQQNTSSTSEPRKTGGIPPRVHNVFGYGMTFAVFVGVVAFRAAQVNGSERLLQTGWVGLLPIGLWCFHFLRRAAESAWVHRYSKSNMPWSALLIEYVYYWGFAFWIAWAITSPIYTAPALPLVVVGLCLFLLSECGNAAAHLMLRRLRPEGSTQRQLPQGFLFERVSCPNYLFEVMSWVGFTILTWALSSLVFTLTGAAILTAWARERHQAYKSEFDGKDGKALYPEKRKAIFPFLY
jgi:very-long-chain enoyl-CoA reductase